MSDKTVSYIGLIVFGAIAFLLCFWSQYSHGNLLRFDIFDTMLHSFWGDGIGGEVFGLKYRDEDTAGLVGWLCTTTILVCFVWFKRLSNGRLVLKVANRFVNLGKSVHKKI